MDKASTKPGGSISISTKEDKKNATFNLAKKCTNILLRPLQDVKVKEIRQSSMKSEKIEIMERRLRPRTKAAVSFPQERLTISKVTYPDDFQICDCLEPKCPGCHFPCKRCRDTRCGDECRVSRSYIFLSVELEGTEVERFHPKVKKIPGLRYASSS